MQQANEPNSKPTLWQVIQSVLWAMLGVQKNENRERDFTRGNPWAYVIVGIVFVTLFVLAIYFVVKVVIAGATR